MWYKENFSELRILLVAILIGLSIITYTLYHTYSDEVSEKITQTIAEHLPEFDNEVAGR